MYVNHLQKSGNRGIYDIKTQKESSSLGMYYGSYYSGGSGLIINFRDSGNIMAGRAARYAGEMTGTVLYAFGEFQRTGNRKISTVLNTLLGGKRSYQESSAHYRRYEDYQSWKAGMLGVRGL